MRTFRFAAISVLLVALAEAGWWANRRYQPINQRPVQQQSLAMQPVSLQQLNSSQTSAPAVPTVGEATAETEQRLGPFSVAGKDYRIMLRKKKRHGGRKAAAAIGGMKTAGSRLEMLEEHIDDALSMAKHIDREGLDSVIKHLRNARNQVVWKLGQ